MLLILILISVYFIIIITIIIMMMIIIIISIIIIIIIIIINIIVIGSTGMSPYWHVLVDGFTAVSRQRQTLPTHAGWLFRQMRCLKYCKHIW